MNLRILHHISIWGNSNYESLHTPSTSWNSFPDRQYMNENGIKMDNTLRKVQLTLILSIATKNGKYCLDGFQIQYIGQSNVKYNCEMK